MKDKSLADKAIKIKGKDYVQVADRIKYFNDEYPAGAIITEILSSLDSDTFVVKASVYPQESDRRFTGHSQAKIGQGMVNTTAALENAETSAVGRALAMMGIGVIEGVASVDEIHKATGETDITNLGACPKCGKELVIGVTSGGKRFKKCSTSKFENGVKSGCQYFLYI